MSLAYYDSPGCEILLSARYSPPTMLKISRLITFLCVSAFASQPIGAQAPTSAHPTKIIIDTDIGDDVDDVFAIGLALTSPEVQILGISSAWGDTQLRARMIDRLLIETNATNIPVA